MIGGDSLSRFFTLHVFVIPGSLLAFLAVHLWLVLRRGISEPPSPGRIVDPRPTTPCTRRTGGRSSVSRRCHDERRVLLRSDGHRRRGPGGHDRSQGTIRCQLTQPWVVQILGPSGLFSGYLRYCRSALHGAETFIILVFPVILIVALLVVPFLSNRGERAPSRRPVAVLTVIVIYTVLGVLTYQGVTAPWSPQMSAWSGEPIPMAIIRKSTPLQLQGALVFQNKNCRNCHAIDGVGVSADRTWQRSVLG